jgi:hypothetical protein
LAAQTVPFARATKLAGIELTIKRVERSAEADGASTTYLATFEPADRFGVLLQAEGIRRRRAHPPARRPRRWRSLDLEPGRTTLPRRHRNS